MKRKIVGIFVCMLLLATAVPAVTSIKNSTMNVTLPKISQASMGGDWIETQKLLASDGFGNDGFGMVSLDGDTALIGACQDNGRGSVYVFIRTGTTWTEQQKFTASDGQADDWFGIWVSLDGDTALIGASLDDDNGVDSGSAYVFTRSGTTWTQQAKLLASDGTTEDWFGYTVSLDGDTALIGARFNDENGNNSGSAYVFTRTGTTWTQQTKLHALDGTTEDNLGSFVSVDGDTALIGAIGVDNYTGSAYVFTRTGTTWTQQAKLLASDGHATDCFSWPLTLDGDTALVGAYLDDAKGVDSGSAYVFTRTGTTWTEQQKLLASDGAEGDQFSVRIALDGDTALIGAGYDNNENGVDSGSAYVFTKSGADLTFSIAGGFGVNAVITNNGTSDANDIPWQIHVEGGILGKINKTVNGTVDIPAGKSVTVKTGMLFGFGTISITAKVYDDEQTATGKQFIIFSMVK